MAEKVDRILSIIIYLLNHENVSASILAQRFHTSVRTIQRDIESISQIGIPVYANAGKYGGYSIMKGYKLNNMEIRKDEQQLVVQALESLATSYKSDTLDSLIEKYNVIAGKEGGHKIFWDFGVTKENSDVQKMNEILQSAASNKQYVEFDYVNISGKKSHPKVQPLAIYFKYYAWYFFCYSEEKEKYINYKVARMEHLKTSKKVFRTDHGDVQKLIEDHHKDYVKTSVDVVIEFSKDDVHLVKEYFPDFEIVKFDKDKFRTTLKMPPKERMWKALLLSFGGKLKVIEPKECREELKNLAKEYYKVHS